MPMYEPFTPSPTLYIRLRRRVSLPKGKPIYLGKIAQILVDSEWEDRLKQQLLYQPSEKDGNLLLLDMLKIIPVIKQLNPDMSIEFLGEPHALIEFVKPEHKPRYFLLILT